MFKWRIYVRYGNGECSWIWMYADSIVKISDDTIQFDSKVDIVYRNCEIIKVEKLIIG